MKTKVTIIIYFINSRSLFDMNTVEKNQRRELSDPTTRSNIFDRAQTQGKVIKTRLQVGEQELANNLVPQSTRNKRL